MCWTRATWQVRRLSWKHRYVGGLLQGIEVRAGRITGNVACSHKAGGRALRPALTIAECGLAFIAKRELVTDHPKSRQLFVTTA